MIKSSKSVNRGERERKLPGVACMHGSFNISGRNKKAITSVVTIN